MLLIVCGSAWLSLRNLGNQYLWQDEAQTSLISKTILTDGVPCGYDGKNFFSQENGAEYGKNYIWRWHTWLPFYVLAGFYKIFGISTFVSRLPFALFGIGTVIITYYFTKAIWPGIQISLISAALLAVSVPYLLLCRQCRYYSMAIFFTILSLYAYTALLHGKKYAALIFFAASTLLLHSQHFYVIILFAAVLLHVIIFRRDRLIILLVVIIAVILVNGPWLIWLSRMNYAQINKGHLLNSGMLVKFIWISLRDIVRYIFPLWLLIAAAAVVAVKLIKTGRFATKDIMFWERLSLPVFFIVFNIIFIAFISPYPFFRYMAPSIPLLIMLIAVIVNAVRQVHILAAIAVVIVLLATSYLKDFIYEITHDFHNTSEGIAVYLNSHGSPDDIAAVSYGDMPLKFYTKMRIIGGFTGENLEDAKNARWVIIRKRAMSDKNKAVREYLLNEIKNWSNYRKIMLNYPDTPWDNREEIEFHYFRPCTDEDRVVIYERTN